MENLLTIYIPSFNRGSLLLKQLNTIVNSGLKNEIKVIVNDNCSKDKSYLIVKKFCEKNNLVYNRNEINEDGNPNIFRGFLKSYNTKYLWILSDNDLLKKSALETTLNLLKDLNLDILFFPHNGFEKFKIEKYDQKKLFYDQIKNPNGMGLISNVIYKSNFIKSSIPIGYDFIFSWYPHLAVLIKSFEEKNGTIGILNKNQIFEKEEIGYVAPPKYNNTKSYFGFVFLAELFEPKIKKIFIKNFTKFWYLRHWVYYSKAPNVFFNETLAYGYINKYSFSFKYKILAWRLIYFLYPIKKHLNF